MLRGAKHLASSSNVRQPITLDVLEKLLEAVQYVAISEYQPPLYRAMFLLAFYAFLRVGEVTVRSGPNLNLLLFDNVSFRKTKYLCLILIMTNFKLNLGKNPVHLEIKSQTNRSFCPVRAMQNYLKVRGAENRPLFCYRSGRPVPRIYFCALRRSAVKFAELDSTSFKVHVHSFRIGAATEAHLQGFSESQIRIIGRWYSELFQIYIRPFSVKLLIGCW